MKDQQQKHFKTQSDFKANKLRVQQNKFLSGSLRRGRLRNVKEFICLGTRLKFKCTPRTANVKVKKIQLPNPLLVSKWIQSVYPLPTESTFWSGLSNFADDDKCHGQRFFDFFLSKKWKTDSLSNQNLDCDQIFFPRKAVEEKKTIQAKKNFISALKKICCQWGAISPRWQYWSRIKS